MAGKRLGGRCIGEPGGFGGCGDAGIREIKKEHFLFGCRFADGGGVVGLPGIGGDERRVGQDKRDESSVEKGLESRGHGEARSLGRRLRARLPRLEVMYFLPNLRRLLALRVWLRAPAASIGGFRANVPACVSCYNQRRYVAKSWPRVGQHSRRILNTLSMDSRL